MFESENRESSNQSRKIKIGTMEAEIRIKVTQLTRQHYVQPHVTLVRIFHSIHKLSFRFCSSGKVFPENLVWVDLLWWQDSNILKCTQCCFPLYFCPVLFLIQSEQDIFILTNKNTVESNSGYCHERAEGTCLRCLLHSAWSVVLWSICLCSHWIMVTVSSIVGTSIEPIGKMCVHIL